MLRIEPIRLEAEVDGMVHRVAVDGLPAVVELGPLEVSAVSRSGATVTWRVANRTERPAAVRTVSLVYTVIGTDGPLVLLRHGYQSWSPTDAATFGIDSDPSLLADFEFVQAVYHADPRRASDGELRAEWVTVLRDSADGTSVLVGFDGGATHDGTLRLRRSDVASPGRTGTGDADAELSAEAFLGGAVLGGGEERALHGIVVDDDREVPAEIRLARWAAEVGRVGDARVHRPYQVGWCSWYQYFGGVTEDAMRANLARTGEWPFEVFQLDDGYQAAIGDWTSVNDSFPAGLAALAADIAAAGLVPGLWLAPFLVAPSSECHRRHPDWVAGTGSPTGGGSPLEPLRAWWNPEWGDGADGFLFGLDTTNPEVLDHLRSLAADLVAMGFCYLKLDFTFSPSVPGRYLDPTKTPAERVRAGYEAIRQGAGEDTFVLGCGVPLANVVGLVDANRIGQDVAPLWALDPAEEIVAGYLDVQPSTRAAWTSTAARAFMHRRLWLNDPDCLMLRTTDTRLPPEAAETWARAVGVSGGLALVSDDLVLLGSDAKRQLAETITIGVRSDQAAARDRGPVSPGLVESAVPTRLESAGYLLTVDPDTGTSTLEGP